MPSRRTVVLVVLAAFAFGVAAAWAKDQGGDGTGTLAQLRGVLGNLSTPWLLVAFLPGARCSRGGPAALLGLAATMAALCGFYLLSSVVTDLGGHGLVPDLRLELSANRAYLEAGIVTGPAFGALGAWWRRACSLRASVLAGALMMGEPLVLALLGVLFTGGALTTAGVPMAVRIVPGWGLSSGSGSIALAVYAVEFLLGLAVVLAAARRPAPARG